jgi:hypothetical protein
VEIEAASPKPGNDSSRRQHMPCGRKRSFALRTVGLAAADIQSSSARLDGFSRWKWFRFLAVKALRRAGQVTGPGPEGADHSCPPVRRRLAT